MNVIWIMEWYSRFFWGAALKCKADEDPERLCTKAPSTRFGFNDNSKFEKRGNVLCSKFSMTELISLSDDLWLNNEPLRFAELDVLWLQGKMWTCCCQSFLDEQGGKKKTGAPTSFKSHITFLNTHHSS